MIQFKNRWPTEILQAVRWFYDRISIIYQFIKPFLDKNVSFEEYGAFKQSWIRSCIVSAPPYFAPTSLPLPKQAYSKYTENFTTKKKQKNSKKSDKSSGIFHISAQNIDCGYALEPPRRGGSNGYPQSTFLSRNKKNNVYPCKPKFYYIKWGLRGQRYIGMFSWWQSSNLYNRCTIDLQWFDHLWEMCSRHV